jgi:hypothetical protein
MIAGNRYVNLRSIKWAEYRPDDGPAMHFVQEIGDGAATRIVAGEDATTLWEALVSLSREEP